MRPLLFVVGWGIVQAVAGMASPSPVCGSKCWENSQFISPCSSDHSCLCEDVLFQNLVLQCLYSQCQTTQFGSALHHTLAACPEMTEDGQAGFPAILRHQGLRKRSNMHHPAGAHSLSAHHSAYHSLARRSASGSTYTGPRPTRSVKYQRANFVTETFGIPTVPVTTSAAEAVLGDNSVA